MSNVAVFRGERPEPGPARPLLGPAEVVEVRPDAVRVRLKTGALAWATMALPTPYEACTGDLLLVIGDADGHYVIGVIRGAGRSVIELPGDVDLRAGGVLRLAGDKGVEIEAPEVGVQAGKLRIIAGAALQRFASLTQRVADLLSTHAGERRTVIDGSSHEQAKESTILTEGKMTINGKAVYLG